MPLNNITYYMPDFRILCLAKLIKSRHSIKSDFRSLIRQVAIAYLIIVAKYLIVFIFCIFRKFRFLCFNLFLVVVIPLH